MRDADRQLPLAGEIFLDHVGHFVRDAQAASRALARLGFAPTPVSVQMNPGAGTPTGTGNVTAMLSRGYLEMLFKTADTPLGQELDAAAARYPGVHLVAFSVADAKAAHVRLAATGFRMRPLVEMQRPVNTGSGQGTAAFTVARVERDEMPEGRIQMLTHHTEDMVWQPRWLAHPNGALALTRVVIAVADVAEAAGRFARFTGRTARTAEGGRTIELDRGRIDILAADAFAALLPGLPVPSLPFIGAYGLAVRSLASLEARLAAGGGATRRLDNVLVVRFPDELGHGAWLFTEAGVS